MIVVAGGCSVLNSYDPVPDAVTGSGGAGGGGEGGATTSQGGGGAMGPTCNEAACVMASGDCSSCQCLEGLVCDCDPVAAGTVCGDQGERVCDGMGDCVACITSEDCPTGETCDATHCVDGTCSDGVVGTNETDVDCGGPQCAPCADGSACVVSEDCLSIYCAPGGICLPCSQQAHCGDSLYCDVAQGTCEQKKELFVLCMNDYECFSGHCKPFGSLTACGNP